MKIILGPKFGARQVYAKKTLGKNGELFLLQALQEVRLFEAFKDNQGKIIFKHPEVSLVKQLANTYY